MKQSRAARAHDLAEWFRAQSENGTAGETDLMARAALALERIAKERRTSAANDNAARAQR
ncbi:MAG TPA: hypothetical protein VLW75_04760 [Rhizomicrobium sp.]|nr:hypothetical protein [Rhizomicrobium sp.]